MSKILKSFRPFTPFEFARKPRGLRELKRWKATEFRQFLLYSGPVALKKILPEILYRHFLLFHVAIKILVNPDFCVRFNDYAGDLLRLFVSLSAELYGPEFCSHKVHNLVHLSSDVARHGCLDSFSAFPFENHMQFLKKLRRNHDRPLAQIVTRFAEINKNQLPNLSEQSFQSKTILEHKNLLFRIAPENNSKKSA